MDYSEKSEGKNKTQFYRVGKFSVRAAERKREREMEQSNAKGRQELHTRRLEA